MILSLARPRPTTLHDIRSGIDLSDKNGQHSLQPPVKFNLRNPSKWPKCRRRFKQLRFRYGKRKWKETDEHLAILPGWGSRRCTHIYQISNDNKKKYVWPSLGQDGQLMLSLRGQDSTSKHNTRAKQPKSTSLASTAWQPTATPETWSTKWFTTMLGSPQVQFL